LICFLCCGVRRLARYAVTAESLSAGADTTAHFEGTPIPTSVLPTAVPALVLWQGKLGEMLPGGVGALGPWRLRSLAPMFALSGTLMMSRTLRIPRF